MKTAIFSMICLIMLPLNAQAGEGDVFYTSCKIAETSKTDFSVTIAGETQTVTLSAVPYVYLDIVKVTKNFGNSVWNNLTGTQRDEERAAIYEKLRNKQLGYCVQQIGPATVDYTTPDLLIDGQSVAVSFNTDTGNLVAKSSARCKGVRAMLDGTGSSATFDFYPVVPSACIDAALTSN